MNNIGHACIYSYLWVLLCYAMLFRSKGRRKIIWLLSYELQWRWREVHCFYYIHNIRLALKFWGVSSELRTRRRVSQVHSNVRRLLNWKRGKTGSLARFHCFVSWVSKACSLSAISESKVTSVRVSSQISLIVFLIGSSAFGFMRKSWRLQYAIVAWHFYHSC